MTCILSMAGVEDECIVEVVELSWLVMEISDAHSDLSWLVKITRFLHRQNLGWSRSRVLVLRWSCEQRNTQ
jgi:hypothetical protein